MRKLIISTSLMLGLAACGHGLPPEKTVNDCGIKSGVLGGFRLGDDCRLKDRQVLETPVVVVPVPAPQDDWFPNFWDSWRNGPYGRAPVYSDGTMGPVPQVPAGCGGVGSGCGRGGSFFIFQHTGR